MYKRQELSLGEPKARNSRPQAGNVAVRPGVAMNLAVVIPTLDDASQLRRLLPQLKSLGLSVVVSDGGSVDSSTTLLLDSNVQLVVGSPNRGEQLARGVAANTCDWLLFLHSDSRLSASALQQLVGVVNCSVPTWGRFDVALEPRTSSLNCIAWFMNWRSRLTKVCTGDQGMFVHRSLLDEIGGVPCQPLMEDIELSRRLKLTQAPFVRLPGPLFSSARRWQAHGVLRTVLSMWLFRLRYWLGASPERLAQDYYAKPQDTEHRLS